MLAHFTGTAVCGYNSRKESRLVVALWDTLSGLVDAKMSCKWDNMTKPHHKTMSLLVKH